MQATGKLILGTVQFGLNYGINNNAGKPSEKIVFDILDIAFKNNIKILDTAEAYGNSQEIIGRYHHSCGNRFEIVTKFSSGRKDLPEKITDRINHNLKVLGVSDLYGYMYHSFNDFEVYYHIHKDDLLKLKRDGIIKKIGVSIYTNSEFEKLLHVEGIDLIQLPFNLLDNYNQRGELLIKAKAKGKEIHTRSAFLQGLFFMEESNISDKLQALTPYLKSLKDISLDQDLSMNDLALNYSVSQKTIDHVLIGVDTPEQLTDNIKTLQHTITESAQAQINAILVKETTLLNPANWNL